MALEDEEWRELSDREIAKMCAVNNSTVSRIRAEIEKPTVALQHSAELPNSPTSVYNDMPIIQEYKRQINELSEKLANQTPPDTSIAVQQAVRQERERAELAMYEYKKKARELEAQLQAVRSTPAPQPVVEVREVVPDDVKARLEVEKANSTLSNSVKLLTPLADKHDTSAIVRELKAQLAEKRGLRLASCLTCGDCSPKSI